MTQRKCPLCPHIPHVGETCRVTTIDVATMRVDIPSCPCDGTLLCRQPLAEPGDLDHAFLCGQIAAEAIHHQAMLGHRFTITPQIGGVAAEPGEHLITQARLPSEVYGVEEAFELYLKRRATTLHAEVDNGSHQGANPESCNACINYVARLRIWAIGDYRAGWEDARA